jgi:uncharacterized membrane protein
MIEDNKQYHPVEQPDDIPIREREDAMGSYLMMFGALAAGLPLPILNLLAAYIYYHINAKKSRFIKFHCLQSLLSQLPTSLLNAGFIFWTIRIILHEGNIESHDAFEGFGDQTDLYWGYLWTVVGANILYIIFSIIGAVKARKGQFYYFVFFGRLSYHIAYKVKDSDSNTLTHENKPPS